MILTFILYKNILHSVYNCTLDIFHIFGAFFNVASTLRL